ncbi:alpha/beta hydrolase [Aureimonas sp. SK2]|uniref:alpha/beta hydrolase n=1 Tax=Aureimonas sp. SK2 TaxID=3015992 RepID=UPI002444CD90|nr:alpha/beta fold hydrolase [Aureimonas sp. SK2]
MFVATDRAPDGVRQVGYGSGRAALRYEELTVSVPPGHQPGNIEWTEAAARNPAKSFVVTRRRTLDEEAFRRAVALRSGGNGTTGIFVHGYNYTLTEAVFRVAQLSADATSVRVPILFSWPSEAAVAGYVADRDAVTYARDDLARLLGIVGELRTKGRIFLVGHSMGGWLVMESLRQLRLEGRDRLVDRFEVALAAPDIDVDVFRRQIAVVGALDPPLTILVAKDDRALAVSQRLSGGRQRVGSVDVDDPHLEEVARRADIRIIDISSVEPSDGTRHDRFVRFATLQSREMATEGSPLGSIGRAGAYVFNTAGAAVASPFTLAGRALGGQ